MTYHFYNCLKLIQTVNNNYHHIVELEELHNLLVLNLFLIICLIINHIAIYALLHHYSILIVYMM